MNGAGFRFHADRLDEVIRQWRQLHEDLRQDIAEAERLGSIVGPGTEFASGDFATVARRSGESFAAGQRRMLEQVRHQLDGLVAARARLLSTESRALEGLRRIHATAA